jgi:hypothetical protein
LELLYELAADRHPIQALDNHVWEWRKKWAAALPPEDLTPDETTGGDLP